MCTEPVTRREREAKRHRDEILDAAAAVFAEKGFHNTTMEDIASASQFAIASLYKHFRSKDAIFIALFESKVVSHLEGLQEILEAGAPFLTLLEALLSHYLEFCTGDRALFRLLVACATGPEWHHEGASELMQSIDGRHRRLLERLVEKGIHEGVLYDLPVSDVAVFLKGVLAAFFMSGILRSEVSDLHQKRNTIRRLLLHGILRTDAPGADPEKAGNARAHNIGCD